MSTLERLRWWFSVAGSGVDNGAIVSPVNGFWAQLWLEAGQP
jgi:hypothetical protein